MSAAADAPFDTDSPAAVRRAIREGRHRGFTNLLARRHVQGNLMIVPAAQADAFAEYCALNPRALPLLGRSEPGSPFIPALGRDLDLRTDVGGYTVFVDGEPVDTPRDITSRWRDDLVAFVLGCSFSFEAVLQAHGVRLRHLEEGNVSAMYVTGVPTRPAGPFGGPLVVSMRALRAADAIRAIAVSQRYPLFHGEPVHLGTPSLIGIADLAQSYGGHGLTQLHDDELPVFWACGATAQLAARQAGLPLCITHHKAHMVVTDLLVTDAASNPLCEADL
ncbi:D-glutamate cyclase family protein [Aquabacterium sp. J223]|uniref:D-glutamate cyclase family protein n=1 Tax=Aquabacterium sp. J223 TaxID=2898431 RepID=UPI0021AE04C3|nr:DUF1445 domain-containing protein [Aquabacterium sp. J223]UUX96144.1 DUF1445 domain-containing protein [Aquabacterium sp. J223]